MGGGEGGGGGDGGRGGGDDTATAVIPATFVSWFAQLRREIGPYPHCKGGGQGSGQHTRIEVVSTRQGSEATRSRNGVCIPSRGLRTVPALQAP